MSNPSILFNENVHCKVAGKIQTHAYVAVEIDGNVDFYLDGDFLLRHDREQADRFIAALKTQNERNA